MNKPLLHRLFLLLLILISATFAEAQEFGGNPPSIKWDQVNTPADEQGHSAHHRV
jgi:hypothetical protein